MVSKTRKAAAQASYQQGERKNFIYNGDMEICQRATSVSGLGNGDSGYHVQDRYKFAEAGAPNAVVTMSKSTTAPDGFTSSLKLDCTTASGTVAAGDLVYFSQIFEGRDLQSINKGDAQARAVTVSFWVNTTKTGTYIVSMYDNDNNRSCSQAYTVSSSNTWEYKTVTFPPDTTGTYGNDTAASLYLHWGLVAGTDWTSGTLATAWQSNVSADQFTGQVDAFDSTSNNFHLTGVQMELGNTATDFQYESQQANLFRCQRYHYRINNMTAYLYALLDSSTGSVYQRITFTHPPMRSNSPTGAISNTITGAASQGFQYAQEKTSTVHGNPSSAGTLSLLSSATITLTDEL
jgi:hypothetical protein